MIYAVGNNYSLFREIYMNGLVELLWEEFVDFDF